MPIEGLGLASLWKQKEYVIVMYRTIIFYIC